MSFKRSFGELFFDGFNYIFMILAMLITIYPFVYILAASFSNSNDLMLHSGVLFLPLGLTAAAYERVFANPSILTGYINTIFVLVAGTAINIFLTSLGAYCLSRKNLAAGKFFMLMILFTMYFSGGLIPKYLFVAVTMRLKNNYLALLLPGAISAWNMIILRTAFRSIPDALEESARIDGANDFHILYKILIPVSMSTIAVLILFYGVSHWNSWFDAMLYMTDRKRYPLQLILREILVISNTNSMAGDVGADDREAIGESIKYATIIVATVPVLLIYPFLQKYFVKGVMVGSIK